MRIKFLSILAAVALLSACETASTGDSASSGAGTTTTAKPAPTTSVAVKRVKAGSQEDLVVNVGDRVFFGFDQFSLSNDARSTLGKQAAWLKANPGVTVRLEGHCDERGTREYNLALGERRANAVQDYLTANGVNPDRIVTISWGKEKPVANGSNEAAWRQNRRGVTRVIGGGS